jgi:hypothetical protein
MSGEDEAQPEDPVVVRTETPDPPEKVDEDLLDQLRENKERRRHQSAIINAWKQQQTQDREIRRVYANWLMVVMSLQIVVINVIFILIGCGLLKFEQWTANVFITAVFAEISALVLLVVKYLFPATADKILDLIDRFKGHGSTPGPS